MFNRKNVTKLLVAVLILVVGLGVGTLLSPDIQAESDVKGKVAYVDIQKIFENHPKKTKAEARFSQVVQTLQQNLKSELETEIEQVTGDERQKLVKEYEQKLNQKANERQQKLIQPILNEIDQTVKEVAKEEGVAVVLSKEAVIYGGHDLTPKVLERVKAKYEKETGQDN